MPASRHLQNVIESAIDFAIIVTDVGGTVTDWNAGAENIFGWRREDMLGTPAERIFTPEDQTGGRVEYEMRVALEQGGANDERWHMRADGTRFWASGEMMPLRDEAGGHQGFVKIVRDRTRQHEAGERLRKTEDWFRTLLETIETAFAIVEVKFDGDDRPVDYRFLEANPAFERQAGTDLRGKWVTEFAPDLERFWFETYGHVARTGETAKFENYAKAFSRWFDVTAIRVGDPAARQIAIFFTDVTASRAQASRNAAMHELSDRLRDLADPARIAAAACEILGRALEASLVGYGTIDVPTGTITAVQDWSVEGFDRLPPVIRSRDYGNHFDDLLRGETVVIPDVELDPRTASFTKKLEAIGARAFVNLPLFERGRLVALLYVGQGEPRAWSDDEITFLRDVMERVRAAAERARREQELRISAAQLRRAQEAGGVGLFSVEVATDILTPTPQFCRLYGLPQQESYPATAFESLIVPGDAHLVSNQDDRLGGRLQQDVEYRIRRPDTGAVRWIARTGRLEYEGGRPVRFVGVARDITDEREAAERLRASEARAVENADRVRLALAAGAIIGTWVWDLPTDRFTVDEAFAVNFGLDPALGRTGIPLAQIVATVHPDDQAGLAAAIGEAIARGGRYAHQYRVRRQDGRYYWLEANGHVEHGPDGTPLRFPGVLLDVEARRTLTDERDRALAQLREANDTLEQRVEERTRALMQSEDALRQSQKMEAVGQLTGGLAHDFNNLLAGITGSLELMGIRIAQGRIKDLEKYMSVAQGAAKRAAALTHRLLAFSRRQTLEPKATDVNALAFGMLDMIRRTVGPSVEVAFKGDPELWSALVDPSQLENALLNLCINARDAMPEGGRITIETENRHLEQAQADMRDMPAGPYLVLSVSDNGSGMPPDVIARAFEPFFTTKPTGEGTGLGLSMIYGFARQSGGQVRIHSVEGEGTTICIFLPRHAGEAEAETASTGTILTPAAQEGQTILVVDDEPSVRMLVTDVLNDLGYTTVEAADGAGGLKLLQSNAQVDLLVTDVGLPGGMNGRQLADAARTTRPDLKVLFITGFAETALSNNGQFDPGMAVMTKPFAVDALAARVREMITR